MNFSLRNLALGATLLAGLGGCDDEGLKATESNDIEVQRSVEFSRDELQGGWTTAKVRIQHAGTLPLKITDIYFVTADEGSTDFSRGFEGCDRVEAGIAPGALVTGELAERCIFMIDERPELPFELDDDAFREVAVTFRDPLMAAPPPTYLVIDSNNLDDEGNCPSGIEERGRRCVILNARPPVPRIRVSPLVVAFANAAGRNDIIVNNDGSGTLQVDTVRIEPRTPLAKDPNTGADVPEFTFTTTTDLPWSISAQGSNVLRVEYAPIDDTEDRADLIIESNDPQTPSLIIELTSAEAIGQLNVTPSPVEFGDPGGPGQTVPKMVTLTNIGLGTVFVLDISIEPEEGAYRYPGQGSFQIVPGGEKQLNINYTPTTAEGEDAELLVRWRDSNSDEDTIERIPLVRSVEGLPAIIGVDPPAADFSDVAAGTSDSQTFTITNTGGADLVISSIHLSDGSGAAGIATDPEFSITDGGTATTIGSGDTHTVEVEFARPADDRTAHVGALVIESNSEGNEELVVFFTANPPAQ